MSNFFENLKLNNLQKKVNALATEVSNIIVGGAPVISGDIDMNNNSIKEIEQLIFNSGNAFIENNGIMTFANKELLTTNDLIPYQLQTSNSDFDLNNHKLWNINGLEIIDNTVPGTTKNFTLINGGLVSADGADTRLYLYTNESGDQPHYLNFGTYALENVGSIEFGTNGSSLTSTDGESLLYNGREIASYQLLDDINGQNQHSLRQITGIQMTSGGGLTFGTQNELTVDPDSQNLTYNNVPIVNASDFQSYLPPPQWVNTATSSLNMQNYNITNINNLVSGAVGPNSINFNNDTSKKLTVLNGDLQYQGATVITNSDFASYLPPANFYPTANQDLNMNNYSIRDASVGEFNAINLAGNTNYHLSATADGLLYNNNVVITESNIDSNLPSVVNAFTRINFNSDSNCDLTGITDGLFYRGLQLAYMQDVEAVGLEYNSQNAQQNAIYNLSGVGFSASDLQLTMNNDGDALWSGATILTSANTNIPPANQTYNVSDQSSLILPNISINPNSVNYIKGTIIGSSFVVEVSAVAINVGGEDPAWVVDTQTTNIIYGPSNSTFNEVFFNATNAGVYLAIQFKEPITDTIAAKIEKVYNS
jgi:hypothetical protein